MLRRIAWALTLCAAAVIAARMSLPTLAPSWWDAEMRRIERRHLERDLRELDRIEAARAAAERRRTAKARALSGTVMEGSVIGLADLSGKLVVDVTPQFAAAWARFGCDDQRAHMELLWRKWARQRGAGAHGVLVRSPTGRYVGEYSELWGYHCD